MGGSKTTDGVVCRGQQVSMHEVWKRQQVHEDARKMHRDKVPVRNFWKMEKSGTWEVQF